MTHGIQRKQSRHQNSLARPDFMDLPFEAGSQSATKPDHLLLLFTQHSADGSCQLLPGDRWAAVSSQCGLRCSACLFLAVAICHGQQRGQAQCMRESLSKHCICPSNRHWMTLDVRQAGL